MGTTRWMSIACMLAVSGCASDPKPAPEYPPMEPTSEVEVVAEPAGEETAEPAEPAEPPPPPVQVVAAERTPIEGKAPKLRINLPRNDQQIRRAPVRVRAQIRNWDLAAAPGKHVHLIFDNEPYIAIRDLKKPIDLHALIEEKLGQEMAPGTHVIRMFPSRAHHESVKEGTPFAMTVFHFQEKSDDFEIDPNAPLLTYSRPKGCSPLGERVLLDFYLTNVEGLAADGTRVRYTIDGDLTGEITQWAPHYIENLAEGEHTVQLQLIGPDGEVVDGPFNDTTRTIQVAASCETAPAATAEGGDAEGEEGEADAD